MFRTGKGTRSKAGNPQVQVQYLQQALTEGDRLWPLPAVMARGTPTERQVREAASCVLDKTGTASLDSAGGLQCQVAKMGALGLAVQLAYQHGTAALVQVAHERLVASCGAGRRYCVRGARRCMAAHGG